MKDDPKNKLLGAVADGATVDWKHASTHADSDTARVWLQNLRVIEAMASILTDDWERSPSLPERIGPYLVLELIGEGGMGSVYRAEQLEPIRREVAVKVVKLGMDTKKIIARFDLERQALALMDHPNIARVLDAGATEQGRPYFVMEYVDGPPITEYSNTHGLDIPQRLELFTQVCEGVQHAHRRGIIHRDLKARNVLVKTDAGRAVPKIIDFGVAKAIERDLAPETLFTELGQVIGSPEYMSPEQADASARDIDTRTDVYSLGVLLYELLVGLRPLDLHEVRLGGFEEICRRIREVEPIKPSVRILEALTGKTELSRLG